MINFLPSQKTIQPTIIVVLIGGLLFFASWILTVNDSLAGGSGYGYGYGDGVVVKGTIYSATWTQTNSPYIIDGYVTIASSSTLTIEPGVVVKFKNPSSSLHVYGALTAVGTNTKPIVFTSYKDDGYAGDTNGNGNASSPAPGDWESIYFQSGSRASTLDYVMMQYGGERYYDAMVQIFSPAVTISNSTMQKSDNMIEITGNPTVTNTIFISTPASVVIYIHSGAPTITQNAFTGAWSSSSAIVMYSTTGLIDGNTISNFNNSICLCSNYATPTFTNNIITNNYTGISVYGGAYGGKPALKNNVIADNISYGLYNDNAAVIVMAESNWWGDETGPFHASNPTGTGNAVSDYVDFSPWLTYDPTALDTTPPANVTLGQTTTDVWLKSITLNWTNPTDPDFDHVVITRRDAAGNQVLLTETATGTTYTDTVIQYNVSYSYTLVAVDASGNASSGVTTVKIVVRNPAPTNLTLTPGNRTIHASWTASSAPAVTLGGYKIRYGTSPRNLNTQIDVGNVTSTTLTGLSNGTRYYVAVIAYNKAGIESPQSSIKSTVPKR